MTTGCVITNKYSHHVTLEYMFVGFVWVNHVNCLFEYTMTNKLHLSNTNLFLCANDVMPWDAGLN